MRIDAKIVPNISQGIIPKEVLEMAMANFETELPRLQKLEDYYAGKHIILDRIKEAHLSNNRIVSNFAKYIVDMSVGYFLGQNINYTSVKTEIDELVDMVRDTDIASHDLEIGEGCAIYGKDYELIYITKNEEGRNIPTAIELSPQRTFVVYDNTEKNNPLFGVHITKTQYPNNIEEIKYIVYTNEYKITYDAKELAIPISKETHNIGEFPIIEYSNNKRQQGDFEQVINLIDAYNILQSDRVNDKEQFVSALLILYNTDLEDEELDRARQTGGLSLMGENVRAEYVVKQMDENMSHILMKDLKDDIFQFSMVANISDSLFSGNASGVALKYKLLSFENLTKIKERWFIKSLKRRLKIFIRLLGATSGAIYNLNDIEITFSRGLPINDKEVADMIGILKASGIISDETLASQLSFVTNPKEEVQKAIDEAEAQKDRNEERMGMDTIDKGIENLNKVDNRFKQKDEGEEDVQEN